MQILIKYEASWRNSFLGGTNNEPLPKNGRDFVGSMTSLGVSDKDGKFPNFINRVISKDTAMGLLNRLIGDQRKLYQTRKCSKYFFKELEERITFKDIPDQLGTSMEMIYIRNITGSEDKESFTGMIKSDDPILNSEYSNSFWGTLALEIYELCEFIIDESYEIIKTIEPNPLTIIERLENIKKAKPFLDDQIVNKAVKKLSAHFPKFNPLNKKQETVVLRLYCSALYLQMERLSLKYDMSSAKAVRGGITGISHNGFTPKDFMARFTTGDKKIVWGNPYLLKEMRKGEGEVSSVLTKSSRTLEIQIDIPKEKAKQLEEMIENAGVSSFYLGKKGLAYVEEIII
jgi:hypothetical protein